MLKKKVLFLTEATYLNTGYATYAKHVMDRLHSSNKYEIAELSIYGPPKDPRRASIKWKNYANMPDPDNEDHVKLYNKNPINQFGAWRFDRVCLDFQPDIVLSIRDFWMDSFVFHSPFRNIFSWCWMPTVDAEPQNPEWIDMFADAEYILTYSDWANNILEKQSGGKINTLGSAPPSASKHFFPMQKSIVRKEFGLEEDINIVGTVMRNQRRKLFPVLFESFGEYLKRTKDTKTYLYCHTSYPDNGWNLAELIHSNNISSRVLFTYVCNECKSVEISHFNDARKQCLNCKKFSSCPSSVNNGLNDEILAKVYNLFDIYVQCANCEGFGLPQVEAAACGVPIACTNYSAMVDVINKLEARPIQVSDCYKELETGCNRAVPNRDSLTSILIEFFNSSKEEQRILGAKTRKLFEEYYNWDTTSEKWMKIIDSCPTANWKQPSRIKPVVDIPIDQKTNEEFMDNLIEAYIFNPKQKNSYVIKNTHKDLNRGTTKSSYSGYMVSEMSPFNDSKQIPISRSKIKDHFKNTLNNFNIWEKARQNRSLLKDNAELWLG